MVRSGQQQSAISSILLFLLFLLLLFPLMFLNEEINEPGAVSAAVIPAAKQPSFVCEEHHCLSPSADDDCPVQLQLPDAINVQAAEPTVNMVACRDTPRRQTQQQQQQQQDLVRHPVSLDLKLQRQPCSGITIAICMDPSEPQGDKQDQEQEVPKTVVNQGAAFLDAANILQVINAEEEQLVESNLESRASSYATDWSSKDLEPGIHFSREETDRYSLDSPNGVCARVDLQTAFSGSMSGDSSVDCTQLFASVQLMDTEHLPCGHTNESRNCCGSSAGSTITDHENVCSSMATSLAQSQEVDSVATLDQFVKNSDSDNHTVTSPSQIVHSMKEVQSLMPMDEAEEARIRAELELEIEKDLEKELENKIFLLSRKLQQLHSLQARRHSREYDQQDSNCPMPSAEVASAFENEESVVQAARVTGQIWIMNEQRDEVIADSEKLMQLALYNNVISSLLIHGSSVQSEALRALTDSGHHNRCLSNWKKVASALVTGAALARESPCADPGLQSSCFQVVYPSSVEDRRGQVKLSKSPSMSKSTKGTLQLATSLAARKQKFDWVSTLRAGAEAAMTSTTTTAGCRCKENSVHTGAQKGGTSSLHNHPGEAATHSHNHVCGTASAPQSREVGGIPSWTTGAAITPDQYSKNLVRLSHTAINGKDESEVRPRALLYHVQPHDLHNAVVPATTESRLSKDNVFEAQHMSHDGGCMEAVKGEADLTTVCCSNNTSNHKPRANFFAHTASSRQKEVVKQAKPAHSGTQPNHQLGKRHLSSPSNAAAGRMKGKEICGCKHK